MALVVSARCPDPKLAKAALAPFHVAADGTTSTSASGFVLLHNGEPVVVTSAAAVLPLILQQRRESGSLSGATDADLAPGAQLSALLHSRASGSGTDSLPLRLLAMAELPGVRQALLSLLAAPSIAGPGGWRVGWLLHRPSGQQAAPISAAVMLQAACHVALLQPSSPAGVAALRRVALPWPEPAGSSPAARQPGEALAAVGAPFGVLEPQHFGGFLSTGVVSAAVPAAGSGDGDYPGQQGMGRPAAALLLSDMRCSPGMEGGPVFAGTARRRPGKAGQQVAPPLAGMLLPPLKAPAAGVEFALVAPAAAVAAAAAEVLGPGPTSGLHGLPGGSGGAADAAPPAQALGGVVAVAAGGVWATGVVISSEGHILTNAHLLHPPAAVGTPGGRQLQPMPAAAAAAAAPAHVLLPGGTGGSWAAADVLFVFEGPLDLAMLQLRQPWRRQPGLLPVALAPQQPRAGRRVWVAGFPAFNPRASPLSGPLVTAGNLAKVVSLPDGGAPAMLLTTAAVHSGASGGAVLDASSGGLLGLVTSNAKHSPSGGGGGATVLPHLNFAIAAAQLAPVVAAAQAAAEAAGGGSRGAGDAAAAAALAAWRALDAQAGCSAEMRQVWRLDRHRQQQQQRQERPDGGAFAGARPPEKLQSLLEVLGRPPEAAAAAAPQRSRL